MGAQEGVVVGCGWGDSPPPASHLLLVLSDTWDGHLAFCLGGIH